MSSDLFFNLLAVALALATAWLWIRRRSRLRRSSANRATGPLVGPNRPAARPGRPSLDRALFGLSLVVFAATRLIGLADFPIYFFTDEAANTVQAADFVRNGFRDSSGQFFPTYFDNNEKLSLSATVYAQVVPYALFGYSVFATRATSVLIAFSGMIAVGLTLKNIFKTRFWWMGVLLLSITPAWFLHSRTAFETVAMVSFYAWFLYFYLQYRQGQVRRLYFALLFGALAFYTYNTGQPGVVLTGLLLLLADFRYHAQTLRYNRRLAGIGLALIVLLALPYLRFLAQQPAEVSQRLQTLDSYWLRDLPLTEKIGRFAQEYFYGLSPVYWYLPDNPTDLIRHQMKGYGNILLVTLPFALVGLALCLRNVRSPGQRAILIAAICAPIGSALVGIHITRLLVFVLPAAIFTTIGLGAILSRLARWTTTDRLAIGLFAVLCVAHLAMLRDALVNGPTWYTDYGLTGMQYGAQEIFGDIKAYFKHSPQTQVWLFPNWLNGSDVLRRFFVPDDPRVYLINFDAFVADKFALDDNVLLVMAREEYLRLAGDRKFFDIRVDHTLNLPDGTAGFYFLRARYSPEADALFAAERDARNRLVQEDIVIDGQTVTTRHSPFDIGRLQDLFDGGSGTLVRTQNANPAIVELIFPEARRLTGVTLTTGSMDLELTIQVFSDETTQPGRYANTYTHLPPSPTLDLIFDPAPGPVSKIRIEIKDIHAGEAAHVHLRHIALHTG